jgi:hypothetical protein
MPQRIRFRRISTVGLVDKGDDPEATVELLKRAETFAEQGNRDDIRHEVWDVTERMSSVLFSALFDAEADQDPGAIILTSLEQFTNEVKAALPKWLAGNASKDGEGGDMDAQEIGKFRRMVHAIGGMLGLDAEEVAKELSPNKEEEEGTEMADYKREDLPQEAQDELEALEAKLAEFEEAEDEEEQEEQEEEVISEEVAKRLDDAEARAKRAEEKADKLEAEKRRDQFLAKARQFKHLPEFTADDFGGILAKIEAALETEEFALLEKVLKGADEAIRQSALLTEIGGSGAGYGSKEAEVKAKVAELQKLMPELSPEQAEGKVFKNEPALYQAVQAEIEARKTTKG